MEDGVGDREKETEQKKRESKEKEKELKQRPIKPYYLPSPQYIPSYKSDPFSPVLTNTLVQALLEEKECLEKPDTEEERQEE